MTTLGRPSSLLTFENTPATESGSDKSLEMCTWSVLPSSSFDFRDARATLYPFPEKVRATLCPTLGPEPRMRMIGDVPAMTVCVFLERRRRNKCEMDQGIKAAVSLFISLFSISL